MLRILACVELLISIIAFALGAWPVSGLCSGRPIGFDCESWFIFGVNIFGPLGLLLLVCSIWSLKKRSWVPQYFLLAGCAMIIIFWVSHVQ